MKKGKIQLQTNKKQVHFAAVTTPGASNIDVSTTSANRSSDFLLKPLKNPFHRPENVHTESLSPGQSPLQLLNEVNKIKMRLKEV